MPLQQICLIPTGNNDPNTFLIQHGNGADGDNSGVAPPIKFGPEHDWLIRAVAVPLEESEEEVLFGTVEEGEIVKDGEPVADVEDGVGDEYAAIHERCWNMASRPQYFGVLRNISKNKGYRDIENLYHNQDFEFQKLADDDGEWKIHDPTPDNATDVSRRNKERIQELILQTEPAEVKGEDKPSSAPKEQRQTLPEGFNSSTLYNLLGIEKDASGDDIQIPRP
jgi:hypothetical protein